MQQNDSISDKKHTQTNGFTEQSIYWKIPESSTIHSVNQQSSKQCTLTPWDTLATVFPLDHILKHIHTFKQLSADNLVAAMSTQVTTLHVDLGCREARCRRTYLGELVSSMLAIQEPH